MWYPRRTTRAPSRESPTSISQSPATASPGDAGPHVSPDAIREQASTVLAQVRELRTAVGRSGTLPVRRAEAIIDELATLNARIEQSADRHMSTEALPAIVAARRHVGDAQLMVLELLADLEVPRT